MGDGKLRKAAHLVGSIGLDSVEDVFAAVGPALGAYLRRIPDGEVGGRKIWISNAKNADFVIVMARVGDGDRRGGITSFIVDKGTPGFILEREIPMVGGFRTYEIVFDDCRIPEDSVLGVVGQGYAPMQLRLLTRRLEMGSTAIGIARRALEMMCEHAKQRETFGVRLADRQAIQWWIADTATRMERGMFSTSWPISARGMAERPPEAGALDTTWRLSLGPAKDGSSDGAPRPPEPTPMGIGGA